MITSNPGGKPPAKLLNKGRKKYPEKKATEGSYGMLKQSPTSTTKKVKSFMKKYGQA